MDSIGLPLPAAAERSLRSGHLCLQFQLGFPETFPTEFARLGWLPLPLRIRLRTIDAENVLDPSTSELRERDLPRLADLPGARKRLIGQLDLCPNHGDKMPSPKNTVNPMASKGRKSDRCGLHGEFLFSRDQASSSDRLASQTVACNLPSHGALVFVRSWIDPLPRDPPPTRWSPGTCGRESPSPAAAPHTASIQASRPEPLTTTIEFALTLEFTAKRRQRPPVLRALFSLTFTTTTGNPSPAARSSSRPLHDCQFSMHRTPCYDRSCVNTLCAVSARLKSQRPAAIPKLLGHRIQRPMNYCRPTRMINQPSTGS